MRPVQELGGEADVGVKPERPVLNLSSTASDGKSSLSLREQELGKLYDTGHL